MLTRYHWLCWWLLRQFVRPQYSVLYGRTYRTLAALWEWSQAQLVRHLIGAAMNRAPVPLPFPFIKSTHPDWDNAAFYCGWMGEEKQQRRVRVEWLVGVQKDIEYNYMNRPLNIPIRVCVVDGVYYVRDGHHRVAKAMRLRHQTIWADVLEVS